MHECYLQNQDTRSRNHWCVVIAHLVLALTADVDRLFELKTMSSFSWIYNLETINGKFAFITRWNVQVLLDMRIFVSREMLFYPSCKMAWCLANHPAQINWYTTRDFNASGLRSLKLKKIISILKEEKTILMSISLQKTSNKCFSFFACDGICREITHKWQFEVSNTCRVYPSSRSVVLSWSKWKFVFIPLNDLVYEMARGGDLLKSYW